MSTTQGTTDAQMQDDDISKRTDRLQIMLTLEEIQALDNWRFEARMPSRSAAVRELLRRGLEAEGYFSRAEGTNASGSFGVLKNKE